MKALYTYICALCISFTAAADGEDLAFAKNAFEQGNQAYQQGQYQAALDYYLQADEHADGYAVNYNLGNTYVKLKNWPAAILHYERALKFDIGNQDARFNLKLAREHITDEIQALPQSKLSQWWMEFKYGSGSRFWAWMAIACSLSSALLFLAYFLLSQPSGRRFALVTGILLLAISAVSVSAGFSARQYLREHQEAIVFEEAVDVRSEPRAEATSLFVLHAGTKVALLGTEEQWFEVAIASGERGWLRRTAVKPI